MTTYLLDVNLLLALTDPMHVHHELAHRWFSSRGQHAWATCPITENGFVRIASHPKYPNSPGAPAVALRILKQLCAHSSHQFWGQGISLRDTLSPGAVITHTHITDVYLLSLAVANQGMLATLDQHIPASAVIGGNAAIETIEE